MTDMDMSGFDLFTSLMDQEATTPTLEDGKWYPAVLVSGPTTRDWTSPLLPGPNGSGKLLAERLAVDAEDLGCSGPVAPRLGQSPPNQDLLDDAGGLLDAQFATCQLHLHGIPSIPDTLGQVRGDDEIALR